MEVKQGFEITKNDTLFQEVIQEIVDYRGDITIFLEDEQEIEGYVYDFSDSAFHLYPLEGDKVSINVNQIQKIAITGKDTAEGKSWEAWVAKKKKEKEEQDTSH